MAKIVICPICGTKFETIKPNKRFCSYTCKEANIKMKRLQWKENNPGYYNEYMKKYREAQKQKKRKEKVKK